MINLNILTDMCQWWPIWWLLPFLLGIALGWAIWAKWQKKCEELEDQIVRLNNNITELEANFESCKKDRTRLRGELAVCQGRTKELLARLGDEEPPASNITVDPVVNVGAVNPISALTSDTGSPTKKPAGAAKYAKLKSDNLQIIEGIGPKMESVLHENGIDSWATLASKSLSELKAILDKYGDKYRIIDPASWAAQAAFARDGNWDGLIAHQKSDGSESKAEKVMVKLGILKAYKENDLKAIEGIGPKIEQLLNNAGIHTWRQLADSSVDRLKSILEAAGPRYQLADPASWPKQSGMAADGNWDALEEFQEFLNGGKSPG